MRLTPLQFEKVEANRVRFGFRHSDFGVFMAEGKGIEPPAAVCAAAYGFEDREAHQSLSAPF